MAVSGVESFVWRAEKALPYLFSDDPRGKGDGFASTWKTVFAGPSMFGSMRKQKRCW